MSEVPIEIPDSVSETAEPPAHIDPATQLLQQQLDVLYTRIVEETDKLVTRLHDELWYSFTSAWQSAFTSHNELSSSLLEAEKNDTSPHLETDCSVPQRCTPVYLFEDLECVDAISVLQAGRLYTELLPSTA